MKSRELGSPFPVALATVATGLGACAIGASVVSPIALGVVGSWLVAGGLGHCDGA